MMKCVLLLCGHIVSLQVNAAAAHLTWPADELCVGVVPSHLFVASTVVPVTFGKPLLNNVL